MRLLIIRHAIAVARGTPDIADEERPLTRRGIRRFQAAARGLAAITRRPDVLLTSSLIRARQTAEIAARAWGRIEPEEEGALAGATFNEVAAAVEKHPTDAFVCIVGHEPDVSGLLARLMGTKREERLTFKKGGAALVDIPGPLAEGGGLIWYLPPRVLRAIRA
jgi:phosphohistidine phosphatase